MPTLGGKRPWTIERFKLTSTTDWVSYTQPAWGRQTLVKNLHASATL